jgi:hypothetical protein
MSNIERRIRLGVIAGVSVLFALAVVVLTVDVAKATPAEPEPVCATWQLRGATGPYPDVDFGDAPADAEVVSSSKVVLVKPTEGVQPGVEFAAFDLDVELEAATAVSVDYVLSDGASTAAGAVRMFGYVEQGADSVLTAPDWKDVAEADSGTLTFEVPAGKIGTLGLVYDDSNHAAGKVTFTNLAIGNRAVSFTECPEPTPSPSVTTPAATTPPATAPPTVEPSATVPPVVGGPSLPVTGVNVWTLGGAGLVLIALGVAVWGLFRPKRVRTTI